MGQFHRELLHSTTQSATESIMHLPHCSVPPPKQEHGWFHFPPKRITQNIYDGEAAEMKVPSSNQDKARKEPGLESNITRFQEDIWW
jgi:hypothetical protein